MAPSYTTNHFPQTLHQPTWTCVTVQPAPHNTDDFCPDAWEAAAAAAAAAALDGSSPVLPAHSKATAFSALGDGDPFDPDAWEAAAAAAAVAATAEGDSDNDTYNNSSCSAPSICWLVDILAQASASAGAATFAPEAAGTTAGEAADKPLTVHQLLQLPSAEAAQQLLLLEPDQRSGLLLLLCNGKCGSRGDVWIASVLSGVAGKLGLAELGVMLAALQHR